MDFGEALQLIMVSVCTGFGLELAKELVHLLIEKFGSFRRKVVK
jgi:hypothetical protein